MEGRSGKTKIGVLTVIDEEFDAVKEALSAVNRVPGTLYFTGEDAGNFVVTKMADRGNVVANEATRDLFEHWGRPDIVMLVGVAGALATGPAQLGDIVIPDYVHYGDFRKITEGADDLRFTSPTIIRR